MTPFSRWLTAWFSSRIGADADDSLACFRLRKLRVAPKARPLPLRPTEVGCGGLKFPPILFSGNDRARTEQRLSRRVSAAGNRTVAYFFVYVFVSEHPCS